jgi:hypothetical protein
MMRAARLLLSVWNLTMVFMGLSWSVGRAPQAMLNGRYDGEAVSAGRPRRRENPV